MAYQGRARHHRLPRCARVDEHRRPLGTGIVDRFNAAFGIGSAGFSAGMVCVAPDRPVTNPPTSPRDPSTTPWRVDFFARPPLPAVAEVG